MDADEKEWREAVFSDFVGNDEVHRVALRLAQEARDPTDPRVMTMDVAAARRYLSASLMRMSRLEVQGLNGEDAAAIWARGALGAARYRQKRSR